MDKKNVVAGLGEIGIPILQLISKTIPAVGYDINQKLIDKNKFIQYEKLELLFCISASHLLKNSSQM